MTISIDQLNLSEDQIIDVSHVAQRVKSSREAIGYSLDDLSETCGLTKAEIARIEDGIEIDLQHLKRIAPALQLSITSLLENQA